MHKSTRIKKFNFRADNGENKWVELFYCTNPDLYKNVGLVCNTYPGGCLTGKMWTGHKYLRHTQVVKIIWKLNYKRRPTDNV